MKANQQWLGSFFRGYEKAYPSHEKNKRQQLYSLVIHTIQTATAHGTMETLFQAFKRL